MALGGITAWGWTDGQPLRRGSIDSVCCVQELYCDVCTMSCRRKLHGQWWLVFCGQRETVRPPKPAPAPASVHGRVYHFISIHSSILVNTRQYSSILSIRIGWGFNTRPVHSPCSVSVPATHLLLHMLPSLPPPALEPESATKSTRRRPEAPKHPNHVPTAASKEPGLPTTPLHWPRMAGLRHAYCIWLCPSLPLHDSHGAILDCPGQNSSKPAR